MVRHCSIKTCKNEYNGYDGITYHKFPLKNPSLLERWLSAIPPDLLKTPVKESTYICSVHFHHDCYSPCATGRNVLKSTARPSLFKLFESQSSTDDYQTMVILPNPLDGTETTSLEQSIDVLSNNYSTLIDDPGCSIREEPVTFSDACVQTSPKRLKPSMKEEYLRTKIHILQKRLQRRETKISNLQQLIRILKLYVKFKQNRDSKNKSNE